MKPRRVLAPLMGLLLLIPAATAYGTDQPVDVTVLPAGLLTVETDLYGMGTMIPGQTQDAAAPMWITNTTDPATGWVVTVDAAGDFASGDFDCDGSVCAWVVDPSPFTIPIDNLSIVGGDHSWTGPSAIVPGSGTFGNGSITIVTGTADAWGSLQLDEPVSIITLSIPGDTATGHRYRTVLTYTILAS